MLDQPHTAPTRWPAEGVSRAPLWIYSDPDLYARELDVIFYGPTWNYVGLASEVPERGSFKRTFVGERPVIMTRDEDGSINVFVNRCAHRGTEFCREHRGKVNEFVCPYHQWTYDLKGNLLGVPFRRGVQKQGGMPADFKNSDHSLTKLKVTERNGAVFASFDQNTEPFTDYLGETMLTYFDRVFDGRKLSILGYSRQLIPANWKLMFENIKDPYHASLLHVFLVSFGLFRVDQPVKGIMDATGRHSVFASSKGEQKSTEATRDMRNMLSDLKLNDARILDPVHEFPGPVTVVMQTLWPNLIVQQQSNTLATRQIIPRGPSQHELVWTYFGYEGDDEKMRIRRLRQANLMGPSGFVSMDDSEVLQFNQEGAGNYPAEQGVIEMGGRGTENTDHGVTESAIRAFYQYYAQVMQL
ncbi:MAG: salicylate 5-hydroxylase large subunit [Alphaproteobacteria bacterium]|nr:salicylate 5-hydroxylase large subunit [Alphaproteobacteria bacterium]